MHHYQKKKNKNMSKYWMPSIGDAVIIEETPHVVRLTKFTPTGETGANGLPTQKVQSVVSIPHPYSFGLLPNTEYVVRRTLMRQDMHYEWIYVNPNEYLKEQGINTLEIPLRYCKPKNENSDNR